MAGPTNARPLGITIIAVLALVLGVIGLFGSLIALTGGALLSGVGVAGGGFVFIGGLVLLALSIAELAIAYGFWTTKAWAWRLGIILAVVNVAWSVLSLVLVRFDVVNLILTIAVAAVWIYYLNLPAIRTAFGAPASGLPIFGNALQPYLSRIKI